MSDDYAPQGGEGTEAAPEVGDSQPEVTQASESEAPARQYVEVDDPDNRYVKVKANDEELELPFSEVVKGYSRTADYTRKTQTLAEQQREAELGLRLQRALESNPETTLRILAEQYGLTVAQAQQLAQQGQEPEFSDPLEQAIHEERQARLALEQRLQQREADEQLRGVITDLRSQFQLSDDDLNQVVQVAYQNNLPIEALPMVAQSLAFQRIQARVRATQDQERQRQEQEAQRQQAAQQASSLVTTGGGAGGLTDRVESDGTMSLRESIEAAMAAAGLE